MSVREFIGARYVPIIVGEWDSTRTYEPLMVVTYQGASYTSRQYVPAGIEITNENYWVLSANYNAQIEAYRQEVRGILPYDETPTEDSTKGVTSDGIKKAIDKETTRATAAEKVNADAIANEVTRAKEAEQTNATAISNLSTKVDAKADTTYVDNAIDNINAGTTLCIGDSWGVAGSWPAYVAAHTGHEVVNKCVGGAGFSVGETFYNQAVSVVSDSAVDNNTVREVIVYGGVNDFRASIDSSVVSTAINTLYSYLQTNFKNARIFIIPGNIGYSKQAVYNTFMTWISQVYQNCYDNSVPVVTDAFTWLMPYGENPFLEKEGEILHPDDAGSHIVANSIGRVVKGMSPTNVLVFNPDSGNETVYNGREVHVKYYPTADFPTNTNTLPIDVINIGKFVLGTNKQNKEVPVVLNSSSGFYLGKVVLDYNDNDHLKIMAPSNFAAGTRCSIDVIFTL